MNLEILFLLNINESLMIIYYSIDSQLLYYFLNSSPNFHQQKIYFNFKDH